MTGGHDPELEGLFSGEPGLERQVNLLRTARLKPPQLDPNFRPALRRRLMHIAYERYESRQRPSLLDRIFSGPGMAVGLAAAAVVLLAFVLVVNGGNWFGPGQVQVTTIGAVAVNQPITVSFNQPMDHPSVEKAIQIEPATHVTYSWHGNNLVIQPASGELAPNTQYHVTVAADAKTAPGVKIGQAAVVAVTTAPLPLPSPSPIPSPSPPAPPQITAEHTLSGTGGSIVGWTPDGKLLFFIDGGDLKSINADGTGLKSIQSGVKLASIAPSGTALAYVTTGSAARLYQAGIDGAGAQAVGPPETSAIGWLNGKPLIVSGTDVGPAGGPPLAKLPNAAACQFSPDSSKLICVTAAQPNATPPLPAASFLLDIGSQKSTPWATPGQRFAWSPDSTRLAYWRDGATSIGAPDGSPGTEVTKAAAPTDASWTPDGSHLLLSGPTGASIVKADGSALRQLSQASFLGAAWSPGGGQFAFLRAALIWIDDLTLSGTAVDLGAAGKIVDQYELARIRNDAVAAAGLLGPSATPANPSPLAADIHLARYFVISSQASATDVRCTVRLIFARGSEEIRYQDEQLVVVPAGAALTISAITDSPAHDLGKGPTVNAVQLQPGGIVVVFDSDLDPKTVEGGARLTGPDGGPVTVAVSYDNRKLTVSAKLTPGGKYHLSIPGSIRDIAGQALDGGYEYDFVAVTPTPTPTP